MTSQNLDSAAKTPLPYSLDYPPPDFIDPVIEVYKKDIDLASVRENLKLTMDQRLRKYKAFLQSRDAWRGAAAKAQFGQSNSPPPGEAR